MPKRDNSWNRSRAIIKASSFKKANAKHNLKEYKRILKNLAKYVAGICKSHDYNYRYCCLQQIRKLVSFADPAPPLQAVINTGIVPQLIYILHFNSRPKLQFEALWILTNIASGNSQQTRLLVRNNVVPSLKRILSSKTTDNEIKSQAMLCMGNIVGDSSFLRNVLYVKYNMLHDVIIPICDKNEQIPTKLSLELMRNTSWTICNFCRKASKKVFFEQRVSIINLFNSLLATNDRNILTDICWAIMYFVENRHEERCKIIVDEIIKKGIILKMINDLIDLQPVIRVLGTIVSIEKGHTNEWTLKLIELGVLDKYKRILMVNKNDDNNTAKKEILWTISNMAANGCDSFDLVVNALHDKELFKPIMNTLKCAKFTIRREAAWVIFNVVSNCDSIKKLEKVTDKASTIIVLLFRLFRCKNEWDLDSQKKFGCAVLETIENLLKLGEKYNNYGILYNALKCQGLEILEGIQQEKKENNKLFLQKVNDVIKLLKYQENNELLLVKCCNDRCNLTKYVNGYETSSVQDGECSSASSVSESGYSRVKIRRFYRCKKCNSAVYCSKRCQKRHWKNGHKSGCRTLS